MKGKGLIIFFSIALILICFYQLSFNFVTARIEKRATGYAANAVLGTTTVPETLSDSLKLSIRGERQDYLDSISNLTVYNLGIAKYTYLQCKDKQLNKGLDLQGGMSVVLQVSIDDLIKALADDNKDPVFLKALEEANKKQLGQPQASYVDLFRQSWDEAAPNGSLASIFGTLANKGKINFNSTNDEVISFIKTESSGAFDRTFNILRSRIDKFGVAQPNITDQPASGRIIVELPGVENPARVRKLLQASAVLEFWETYDNREFYQYLQAANTSLKNHLALLEKPDSATLIGDSSSVLIDTTKQDTSTTLLAAENIIDSPNAIDALLGSDDSGELDVDSTSAESDAQNAKDNPLFITLNPALYQDAADNTYKLSTGPVVGYAKGSDTAKVNDYLRLDFIKALFPRDVRLLWDAKPLSEDNNAYALYAIKMGMSQKAPLEGDMVTNASRDADEFGNPEIKMQMNTEGASIWANLTGKQENKYGDGDNGFIAIVLDNYVYSAPRVSEKISGGSSSISGNFTVDEANDLANILQAGKLPAPARIISEDVVGPTLGEENIRAGLMSILVAFIGILLFMLIYYNTSGIIADLALFFNVFFIIGVLASIGATLTLSGIAGIVLTMGMAVDANVLIHERIKEELAKGKSLMKAVHEGHGKAWSAIFDSNITTLIAGLVLWYFGLGPVLGYATTLNIGVILTIFTAVFMAQLVFEFALNRGWNIKFVTPISRNNFTNRNFQFVGSRKKAYIFGGLVCAIMIGIIIVKGFTFGVDFTGGRSYIIRFENSVSTSAIKETLDAKFGISNVVKTYGSGNQVSITSSYLIENNTTEGDSLASTALYDGLASFLPPGITWQQFQDEYLMRTQTVGPSISADIRNSAYKAVIFGIIGIFLYILLRFRRWQFATGTVIALLHDIIIVMGLFSLLTGILPFSLDVDETFIAVILTVIGYSVNDKVVVFDRVREFLREHAHGNVKSVINDALNNTLNRTIMTNVTVMIVLLTLFIFGGEVIRGFAFGLIIGLLVCTYSSIFIAAPLVVDLSKEKEIRSGTSTAPAKAPAMAAKS